MRDVCDFDVERYHHRRHWLCVRIQIALSQANRTSPHRVRHLRLHSARRTRASKHESARSDRRSDCLSLFSEGDQCTSIFATCSEELLDRLLLRVRVARMRFGMAKVQLVRPVTLHQPTRSDLSTLISRRDQPVVGPAS